MSGIARVIMPSTTGTLFTGEPVGVDFLLIRYCSISDMLLSETAAIHGPHCQPVGVVNISRTELSTAQQFNTATFKDTNRTFKRSGRERGEFLPLFASGW